MLLSEHESSFPKDPQKGNFFSKFHCSEGILFATLGAVLGAGLLGHSSFYVYQNPFYIESHMYFVKNFNVNMS